MPAHDQLPRGLRKGECGLRVYNYTVWAKLEVQPLKSELDLELEHNKKSRRGGGRGGWEKERNRPFS
jgi:hypothetical protein